MQAPYCMRTRAIRDGGGVRLRLRRLSCAGSTPQPDPASSSVRCASGHRRPLAKSGNETLILVRREWLRCGPASAGAPVKTSSRDLSERMRKRQIIELLTDLAAIAHSGVYQHTLSMAQPSEAGQCQSARMKLGWMVRMNVRQIPSCRWNKGAEYARRRLNLFAGLASKTSLAAH